MFNTCDDNMCVITRFYNFDTRAMNRKSHKHDVVLNEDVINYIFIYLSVIKAKRNAIRLCNKMIMDCLDSQVFISDEVRIHGGEWLRIYNEYQDDIDNYNNRLTVILSIKSF